VKHLNAVTKSFLAVIILLLVVASLYVVYVFAIGLIIIAVFYLLYKLFILKGK
jgi:hypothetical protein